MTLFRYALSRCSAKIFCELLRSLSRWERGPIGAASRTPVLASVTSSIEFSRSHQTSPTNCLACDDIISKKPDKDVSQARDFCHVLLSPPVCVCNFQSTRSFRGPAVYDSYGRVSSKLAIGALKLFAKCKFEIPTPPVECVEPRGQKRANTRLLVSFIPDVQPVCCVLPRLVGHCRRSPTDGSDMT